MGQMGGNGHAKHGDSLFLPNFDSLLDFHSLAMTCSHTRDRCTDSRPHPDGSIRRRRLCLDCGHKWNTIEVTRAEYDALRALSETAPAPEAAHQAYLQLGKLLGYASEPSMAGVIPTSEVIERMKAAGVF
jgi:hypothetical protein